jgi:hypothetical protein
MLAISGIFSICSGSYIGTYVQIPARNGRQPKWSLRPRPAPQGKWGHPIHQAGFTGGMYRSRPNRSHNVVIFLLTWWQRNVCSYLYIRAVVCIAGPFAQRSHPPFPIYELTTHAPYRFSRHRFYGFVSRRLLPLFPDCPL